MVSWVEFCGVQASHCREEPEQKISSGVNSPWWQHIPSWLWETVHGYSVSSSTLQQLGKRPEWKAIRRLGQWLQVEFWVVWQANRIQFSKSLPPGLWQWWRNILFTQSFSHGNKLIPYQKNIPINSNTFTVMIVNETSKSCGTEWSWKAQVIVTT